MCIHTYTLPTTLCSQCSIILQSSTLKVKEGKISFLSNCNMNNDSRTLGKVKWKITSWGKQTIDLDPPPTLSASFITFCSLSHSVKVGGFIYLGFLSENLEKVDPPGCHPYKERLQAIMYLFHRQEFGLNLKPSKLSQKQQVQAGIQIKYLPFKSGSLPSIVFSLL